MLSRGQFCPGQLRQLWKGGEHLGRFDKGITSYTVANLDMNIYFPEDEVRCRWCRFIQHYDNLDRDKCSLTNEILFSREFVGNNCPLVILNQVDAEELNK